MTSDTCNGVRKTRRIILEQVNDAAEVLRKYEYDEIHVLEVDCCNHLRNVWLGGTKNSLYTLLVNTLREELDETDSRLRVFTGNKLVLRDYDKEFSLCANYPKWHRELFLKCI